MPRKLFSLGTSSLTMRVALAVTTLLVIGGVLVSIAAFAYGRQAAQEAYDRLLLGAANDIAGSISVVNGEAVVDLSTSAFQLLALAPDDRIAYRVIGVDGRTLTGYDELAVPKDLGGTSGSRFFDGKFTGEDARYVLILRRIAERSLNGTIQVIVGHTMLARDALALDITRKALFAAVLSGVAMLLLAVFVVRSALKPLDRIAQSIAGRDPHDLTPVDPYVPREAAVLIGALNGFMARLDRQMSAMRNLISDTAHQLRTPVAALRAQADLAAGVDDEERLRSIVARIHARSVSLGALLDQLLSRALVVHRGDSAKREILDLRDVALDVFESGDFNLLAPEAGVRLEIGEEPVEVLADVPSLQEAVKNLVANAIKHGKAPVEIGVSVENGEGCIWVRDAGTGLPPSVEEALGERFLRSAVSRGDSSGLGLSIALAVAEAFDGRLSFTRPETGGFRAAVVLPLMETRG
ncbi:sensor histidine kinase [Roseibium litorale]|uniref:histidine kinase n=1 Tax=Roseibium litorale TaxID=2803841 RepID=A0ABR9CJZ1_9HYPH|nr:sensor histidine kinase [Roseibium litorale]MBD8891165.1 sensor histidine kinase N-terminal domain-containing protein [Roseibium litorale]